MARELTIVVRDSEMNDICRTRRREVYDDFPKIVCLCGSGRFREAFDQAECDETLAGHIVLTIGCNTKDVARDVDFARHKPALDELHKRKIDLADEIFVLNVGGYIGASTRSEIEYAQATGKPIRYLDAIDFKDESLVFGGIVCDPNASDEQIDDPLESVFD